MENKEFPQQFFAEPGSNDGLGIDYKRLIHRAFRFWYLIVVAALVALTGAFLVNRYSTRIYPITASIIVKEKDDISGAELLYNNPLLNFKRNYLNEPYIIKSYPLVQRVVEDLNFDVAFYREGNILTTEVYGEFPVKAMPIRSKMENPSRVGFRIISEETFELQVINDSPEDGSRQFHFGDTISYEGFHGVFLVDRANELPLILNQRFIFAYVPPSTIAAHYIENLKAEWAEEGAGVVNLSLNGSNPKKEEDFLYGLIRQYQKNDLEIKNEAASRTVDFISRQLEGISDSLNLVERRLERFKNKNVFTDLKGEALRLYEKIEGLERERAQLRISKNYYNYLIDYIQRNEELHQIILPSSVGIVDPILSGLVSQMNELQLNIKMLGKEANPLVSEGKRRITEMKKDIVESVRNQESTDDIKLKFLNQQIDEIEKQLGYLPLAERTLVAIERNYALQENLYIFLLQKKSEAAISKASNTSDIILVNPPRSGMPISPRPLANYILACALGVGFPLLILLLIEVFDNKVQSREDIEKITSIPIIGGVGHKRTQDNLAVYSQPKSIIAESFRSLRSSLTYFVGQKERAVFMITSSISGEGKTFTSVNLASILALSGKRTLIVGADMRRPKLSADFDLHNNIGLSTYLAGLAEFPDVRQKTSFENLDLISGGPIPPNPSELLLTDRMEKFIQEARKEYDYIIIDTPPLAIVTDAFVLSAFADHTLFLVRQNYTAKAFLRTAEEFYASGKLRKMSVVLNDIYRVGPGYAYGYAYSYGYTDSKGSNGYYVE